MMKTFIIPILYELDLLLTANYDYDVSWLEIIDDMIHIWGDFRIPFGYRIPKEVF